MSNTPSDTTEEFQFRNPAKQVGFAQLYHVATMDSEISDGALRTFLLYLKYAQQKTECWPGRERLARERGVTAVTISRHNKELVKAGYITRQRRLGKSSLTYIEDYEQIPRLKKLAKSLITERIKNDTIEDVEKDTSNITESPHSTYQESYIEEESIEKEPVEEEEDLPASGENSPPSQPEPTPEPESPQDRLERLRQDSGGDPLGLAAYCEEKQQANGGGGWTVPPDAGGADTFRDGPVDTWCELVGLSRQRLSDEKRATWAREFRRVAALWGEQEDGRIVTADVTAEIMAWAFRQWKRANDDRRIEIPGNIGWKKPTISYLFEHRKDDNKGFSAEIGPLLCYGLEHGCIDFPIGGGGKPRNPRRDGGTWSEEELEKARQRSLAMEPVAISPAGIDAFLEGET